MTPRARSHAAVLGLIGAFLWASCSGSISCGSCGGPIQPIPGGFDTTALIDRAAQIRVTNRGLDLIETKFQDLVSAYVSMDCGMTDDVPCPTDFIALPGTTPNPTTCDATRQVCIEQISGAPGPAMGFEIENDTQSNAVVCSDDPTSPTRRRCYIWLRMETLALSGMSPNRLQATLGAQVYSTAIPFHYNPLDMDCLLTFDSGGGTGIVQDFVINAELGEWTPPSGMGGRQLKITIGNVDAMIPDEDVLIAPDPVRGGGTLCRVANLAFVKNLLISRLTGSLANIVRDEVGEALGWICTGPDAQPCPAQTTCNAKGYCEESGGVIVPTKLGMEGRMDFSSILGNLTGGRPGQEDVSFFVGGTSTGDTGGIGIGVLGGAEVVTPDPTCSIVRPAPRLRPGFTAPPSLPSVQAVDLDHDGTTETSFMMALGVSDALLDQLVWSIYTTGLFCQKLSAYDFDLLNTGSLALLIPSLNQLSHADRYRHAIFPARVSIFPRGEPTVSLGAGKIDLSGSMPRLVEPLIDLLMDDLEMTFYAMIEDRWVRLMTVSMDIHFKFGAVITPSNEVELVLGGASNAVSDVRVTNSELLAETTMELADAVPGVVQIFISQIAGGLPPLPLPRGAELGGFLLEVLGIRGVESTTAPGTYPNLAVYADLDFDPALVPNLSLAADTRARLVDIELPSVDELAVTNEGGPIAPAVVLELSGSSPENKELEYQLRVDGSSWSPFFPSSGPLRLERGEFLFEGRHRIDVRSRVRGEYRTLDATPASLEIVIDPEPPFVRVRPAFAEGGFFVSAYDVVSRDAVRLELGVGDAWTEIAPRPDELVLVPELRDVTKRIAVRATDEAGRVADVVVREGKALIEAGHDAEEDRRHDDGGCRCVAVPRSSVLDPLIGLFIALVLASSLARRAS